MTKSLKLIQKAVQKRLKKGDTDPQTGLIVYRYFSHNPDKPYLVTPERFQLIRDKEEKRKAKWAVQNKEKLNLVKSSWVLKNPEKVKEARRQWFERNKDTHAERGLAARKKNPETYKKIRQKSYAKNKAKIFARMAKRNKERVKEDPVFAMKCRLRARVSAVLAKKKIPKGSKTEEIIGCGWNEFAEWISSQFKKGMKWENRDKWHIDHIVPLASAKNESELFKLCRYTNLRPIWKEENLSKGAKEITHQMALL